MARKFTYKKVKVDLPDNISGTYFKKMVDALGSDYSFSMQHLIDFLSKNKPQ